MKNLQESQCIIIRYVGGCAISRASKTELISFGNLLFTVSDAAC